MTNKRLLLGIFAVTLIFGMTVIGCKDDPEETVETKDPHKITITGLGGKTGSGTIQLYSYLDGTASGVVAGWQGTISGDSVTASMQARGGGAWTGSGQFHILIGIGSNSAYAYTNGQTLEQLGISTANDLFTKLPKYNITGTTTTIAFDKFIDVSGI